MGSLGVGGFQISGEISTNRTAAGTLYTVPADSMAFVNIKYVGSGSHSVTVNGEVIHDNNNLNDTATVGPGQVIALASISSGTVYLIGALFTNT